MISGIGSELWEIMEKLYNRRSISKASSELQRPGTAVFEG